MFFFSVRKRDFCFLDRLQFPLQFFSQSFCHCSLCFCPKMSLTFSLSYFLNCLSLWKFKLIKLTLLNVSKFSEDSMKIIQLCVKTDILKFLLQIQQLWSLKCFQLNRTNRHLSRPISSLDKIESNAFQDKSKPQNVYKLYLLSFDQRWSQSNFRSQRSYFYSIFIHRKQRTFHYHFFSCLLVK